MRASFHGEHLKISELTKPLYFQSSWFRIVALEFSSKSRMGSPKFTPKSPSTEKAQQNRDLGDDLILVVEDDPDTRTVLSFILSKRGYRVWEAENGRSALEKMEIQRPRLVLTDLQMAVPSTLYRLLLRSWQNTPSRWCCSPFHTLPLACW